MVSGSSRLGSEMDRSVVLKKWLVGWPGYINSYYLSRDLGIGQAEATKISTPLGSRVLVGRVGFGNLCRSIRVEGVNSSRLPYLTKS